MVKPTKAMNDAFREGFQNPGAPLTPGEVRVLRSRAGPQLVFVDDTPAPINVGEISHSPCTDDSDIIDAEIVE